MPAPFAEYAFSFPFYEVDAGVFHSQLPEFYVLSPK